MDKKSSGSVSAIQRSIVIMRKLKVMTIAGTRPELIRLSEIIKKADIYFDHIFVHTGQNYDARLNLSLIHI